MGKYAKYVNDLRLWTEVVRPSYRGKMADFTLMFDEKVYPDAPLWVETFHAFAPGTGAFVPGDLPIFVDGKEVDLFVNGGQHAHDNFDELFLFFGTNPHDNTALGGEVEFWLGEGEDAQKFIARTPTAEWVPRGVAHNPHLFTKVNNPPNFPPLRMVSSVPSMASRAKTVPLRTTTHCPISSFPSSLAIRHPNSTSSFSFLVGFLFVRHPGGESNSGM